MASLWAYEPLYISALPHLDLQLVNQR